MTTYKDSLLGLSRVTLVLSPLLGPLMMCMQVPCPPSLRSQTLKDIQSWSNN